MDLATLHEQYKAAQAQLADVTERYNAAKNELDHQIEALERKWAEKNAELLKEHEETGERAKQQETGLRNAIILAYDADPSKKTVAPGLSVRITVKPVYDREKAFAWAREHGLALALDAKAFEKIASVQALDFVNTEETIVAVIGK
jgi:hypothetical protein